MAPGLWITLPLVEKGQNLVVRHRDHCPMSIPVRDSMRQLLLSRILIGIRMTVDENVSPHAVEHYLTVGILSENDMTEKSRPAPFTFSIFNLVYCTVRTSEVLRTELYT